MQKAIPTTLLLAGLLAAPGGARAIGNALSFDAARSSYVQVPRPVSDDFTIELWVKTSMASPTGTQWWQGAGLVDGEVAGATNDFGLVLLNGKAAFGVGNPDVTIQSATTINDGGWHHLAATRQRSSGLMLLYVDGVQEASSAGTTTSLAALTAPANLRLGGLQTGTPYFTGQLDEVRLWSTVRPAASISATKNYLVPGGTAGLAAYYRLDEGSGTSAGSTGAGAAGTLVNAPGWVTPSSAPLYGVPVIASFTPSGVVGSALVIQGSNFTGATSVLVNGTAAAFVVNSDGQLTATVPVGATSGPVSVVGPVNTAAGTATSGTAFAVLPHLAGTVFDDVNYGGGAGRALAAATSAASSFGSLGRPGATVELYLNGALQASTTTDAGGVYRFYNLATGTYTVRVVSATVSSCRTGGATAGLLPIVTYLAGTTDQVGGPNPALPDAAANAGSQSLAALSSGGLAVQAAATAAVSSAGSTTGVDFGFNFDLVVNTKASGQGSLAQFILNSNALGDESKLAQSGSFLNEVVGANSTGTALPAATETSLFMVPDGAAHAGLRAAGASPAGPASQLTGGVAVISPSAAGLPAISGPATVVNGWTQTYNVGNTNSRLLGTGGPTGVNNVVLPQLNAPEVQLSGTSATSVGLDLAGAGSGAMGLAVFGFGNGGASDSYANVRASADNVTILGNFIGTTATAFAVPNGGTKADGIRVTGGAGLLVRHNLIGFNQGKGLTLNSGVTGATINQNEVRNNAIGDLTVGGLDVQGSACTISNNLVINNLGAGLDGPASAGGNTWTGNTVTGNGAGSTSLTTIPRNSAGVRVYGAGNTISQNVIYNNYGAGILVNAGASTTVISQNSIYGNGSGAATNGGAASGQVGIDLQIASNNANVGTSPFVTLNSTATAGANSLITYPILKTASLQGTTLTVRGLVASGRTVELFLATPNAVASPATGNNFGQGSSYLGTITVTRTDSATAYSGTINGFAQGSGSGVPFSARLALSSLTAAQRAALAAGGAQLTATATAASLGTSEFSGIVRVATAPTAYAVTNQKIAAGTSTANPALALNPGLTSPQAASDPASTIASFTVQPATNGTLLYNGTAVGAALEVPAASTDKLTFQPTVGFTGNATFAFSAKNAAGTSSNSVTYTVPVVASNSFVANDDGLDAKQTTTTAGNVVLNDLNPANTTNYTTTLVAGPTHGTLTLRADGSYTYTPTSGYLGADSFVYKVCAAGSTTDCSNTATVAINVYDPATVCSSATGPNLLQNPGFEAGNDGSFTSAYTFVPRLKPDGTANSAGLQPETTYAVDTDAHYYHGSFSGLGRGGSGNFMIVNGAANQSKVYSQVVSVVPDRYYTFSGWAQSVNPASPAILGFVINGKSASVSTTLTTAPNDYTQFSGVWYSGTSRTATFEVRDINRSQGGNDFGLDDLYFGTCSVNLQATTKTQSPSVPYGGAPTNLDPLDATLTNPGVAVASFVVQTVPAEGVLRLGGPTGTLIVPGQVIPYAQRGAVYYVANGRASVMTTSYTAVDSEGAGSNNIATYTVPMTASPLPVVLTAFAARASGTAALLDWATASEQNSAYFAVERSRTGQPADFVAIGQLAGQGTTAVAHTYRFADPNAAATGTPVYYRLCQVDANGRRTYSPVRAVSFAESARPASLALFPNPAAGPGTTLDLSPLPATATYQVRLLDATGRASRQWALPGGQPQPLGLAGLAPGHYLLLVSGPQADGTPLRQVLHLNKE